MGDAAGRHRPVLYALITANPLQQTIRVARKPEGARAEKR
jgi:hypothetical protein